jgi:hypothetical protein
MRTIIFCLTLVLGGCSLNGSESPQAQFKKNPIRPDILVEFERGEATVSNVDPIAEAIFSLLESDTSQILLSASIGESPNHNQTLPIERMSYLYDALLKSGVPDYKIKRVTRYQGYSNNVEVYALPQGWQGLPYDMLHYGFMPRPKLPAVVVKTTPKDYVEPTPADTINSFLVKQGSLKRVLDEFTEAAGWDAAYLHLLDDEDSISLPNSYEMTLSEMPLPLTPEQVKSVVDFILEKEQLNHLKLRLHVNDKAIVLTETMEKQ